MAPTIKSLAILFWQASSFITSGSQPNEESLDSDPTSSSYIHTASGDVGINGSGRIRFLLVANMFSIGIHPNGPGNFRIPSLQTK